MKAFVDYLGLTFRTDVKDDGEMAWSFLQLFAREHLGPEVALEETGRGWRGYRNHATYADGAVLAAWGGNNDTFHFELTGQGCTLVKDWAELRSDVEAYKAKITRCDVTSDDIEGQTYNIAWCKAQYEADGFKPQRGSSPLASYKDDMGSRKGCTFYVGSRESGKLFRGYEKGRQLGDPESEWFRLEVEYRAVHRELPAQMLTDPGAYLAGSYPCLADISLEQCQVKTVAYTSAAILEKAIDHAKKQAGRALHAVLTLNGGDIGAALARIYRPELPARLKTAVLALVSADETERTDSRHGFRAWMRGATDKELRILGRASNLELSLWRRRQAQPAGLPALTTE